VLFFCQALAYFPIAEQYGKAKKTRGTVGQWDNVRNHCHNNSYLSRVLSQACPNSRFVVILCRFCGTNCALFATAEQKLTAGFAGKSSRQLREIKMVFFYSHIRVTSRANSFPPRPNTGFFLFIGKYSKLEFVISRVRSEFAACTFQS